MTLFPYPIARLITAKIYAFIAMMLGLTVLLGWWMRAEPIVRLIPDTSVMAIDTALFTALAGFALCCSRMKHAGLIRGIVGFLLIVGASGMLLENFLGLDLGLDLRTLHESIIGPELHPGRLAPTTCLAFFLIGFVLQRLDAKPGVVKVVHMQCAIGGIIAMAVMGLAGYFLDLNLLYAWYKYNRMALPTTLAISLLALSLFFNYQASGWATYRRPSRAGSRIVTIGTVLLLIMGMAAGLTGFVMFMDYQKTSASVQLKGAAIGRAMVVESSITDTIAHMRYASTRTRLADDVRAVIAAPTNPAVQKTLQATLGEFITEGFTSLTVIDAHDHVVSQFGKRIIRPTTEIKLRADVPARLMWSQGFMIEASTPIKVDGTVVAMVEIQRRFDSLSGFVLDMSTVGNSADTALCGYLNDKSVGCFPTYQATMPGEFYVRDRRGRLPILDAMEGHSGIQIGTDFRGERVLAAYAPVGDLGLGLILKLDSQELFGPIRALLERTLMTLVVLLLLGAFILRKLIRPLVVRIIESEKRAQQANQLAIDKEIRTRTVVDHVFDGILSMNADGVILTCNPAGCSMFGYSQDELVGKHFSFLLPPRHRNAARAFFLQYQHPDYPTSLKTHMLKLRGYRQGGSEFHFELGTNEVILSGQKGYVGILHDVTDNFEARKLLARSEKRLRTITDNLPALVGYVDNQGEVLFANKTYEIWYGKPVSEIIGDSLEALLGDDYAEAKLHVELALKGQQRQFEQRAVSAYSLLNPIHCLTTYIPDMNNNGSVSGFYVLASDITERKAHEEALRHLAYHDSLTDLPNRRLFNDRLDQAMARCIRRHTNIAVMYLDIDRFKSINDSLGHDNGDLLLKEFAQRLVETVRATDTIGRMGGDEFTIVMEDSVLTDDVIAVADKILAAVRKPIVVNGQSLSITTSIGIAMYAGENVSRTELIKISDEALYTSKQSGRDRYTLRHYTAPGDIIDLPITSQAATIGPS